MQIGIPGGLLFHTYEPFIRTFFNELGLSTQYSVTSDKEILNLGTHHCVDEACLPMKIFHGHVAKLQKDCDYIAVPRIMKCEFGESICPKFEGLPELVKSGTGKSNQIFSDPLYLDNPDRLYKTLRKNCRALGISDEKYNRALTLAMADQRRKVRGIQDSGYAKRVFLAGHPYNIYDPFANMNLIDKLHRLDVGVITAERVDEQAKREKDPAFIKDPYWLFLVNNYGSAVQLAGRKEIDGIIYLSSFNCGTDSITIELIKNKIPGFPILVLKLDEQTGEAGMNTRLEAFREVLK